MTAARLARLPSNRPALEAELIRLERELGATRSTDAIRLIAAERRRVIIELDHQAQGAA